MYTGIGQQLAAGEEKEARISLAVHGAEREELN